MALWKVDVIEKGAQLCRYAVEADTVEEALRKAHRGDTDREIQLEGNSEIVGRDVTSVPIPILDAKDIEK